MPQHTACASLGTGPALATDLEGPLQTKLPPENTAALDWPWPQALHSLLKDLGNLPEALQLHWLQIGQRTAFSHTQSHHHSQR